MTRPSPPEARAHDFGPNCNCGPCLHDRDDVECPAGCPFCSPSQSPSDEGKRWPDGHQVGCATQHGDYCNCDLSLRDECESCGGSRGQARLVERGDGTDITCPDPFHESTSRDTIEGERERCQATREWNGPPSVLARIAGNRSERGEAE